MDKIAQKRSRLNRLREFVNTPGAAIGDIFNPEMKRVMQSIKEKDDNIRTVITGEKIGEATIDVPSDPMSLKDMLKSARSNFNRREYMKGIADLGRFHKRMYDVSNLIKKLDLDINKIHHNFLFQGLETDQGKHLEDLRTHMPTSTASEGLEEYFIKEAGIWSGTKDFVHNLVTDRGRTLAAWEKRYPNVAKDLKTGGIRLTNHAQEVLENTIGLLKEMGVARATRKVDAYVDAAHKIQFLYNKFDSGEKGFRAYYNNIVEPWLKKFDDWKKSREEGKPEVAPETTPEVKTTIPEFSEAPFAGIKEPNTFVSPTVPVGAPSMSPSPSSTLPAGAPVVLPPPLTDNTVVDAPLKSEQVLQQFELEKKKQSQMLPPKPAHAQFMKSLEKLGNENPLVLAGYISKYAKSIQLSDMETAIKLFAIVKQLKQ